MPNKKFLVDGPITPDIVTGYITKLSEDKTCGANSFFLGRVRNDRIDNRVVRAIEYSAYDEMAEKEAGRIGDIVKCAFSDVREIIILHSTGIVKTGEISLLVIVSAGHRDQSDRACRHVLEMIKETFPVWKKELFDDDSHRWQ